MQRITNIVNDSDSTIRVYLLKRRGRSNKFDATIFPNALDDGIKKTYSDNYNNFISDREVKDYDCVHSEKGTIKQLKLVELEFWVEISEAMSVAEAQGILLNKKNFSDDYSIVILEYNLFKNDEIQKAYLIAKYKKVDSWYKNSVIFGFLGDSFVQKDKDIFVLNGCIDTAIVEDDVFVLQENSFEKIFNYYEKSKSFVYGKKSNIENWTFIDKPDEFFTNVMSKKGKVTKLARALQKSQIDFTRLNPTDVRRKLEMFTEFSALTYDTNDRICYTYATADIIIDILRHSYTRDLFSESIVKTKGV